jgi:hypothetical protein
MNRTRDRSGASDGELESGRLSSAHRDISALARFRTPNEKRYPSLLGQAQPRTSLRAIPRPEQLTVHTVLDDTVDADPKRSADLLRGRLRNCNGQGVPCR